MSGAVFVEEALIPDARDRIPGKNRERNPEQILSATSASPASSRDLREIGGEKSKICSSRDARDRVRREYFPRRSRRLPGGFSWSWFWLSVLDSTRVHERCTPVPHTVPTIPHTEEEKVPGTIFLWRIVGRMGVLRSVWFGVKDFTAEPRSSQRIFLT